MKTGEKQPFDLHVGITPLFLLDHRDVIHCILVLAVPLLASQNASFTT
jgi:hypothetical protein